jgi:hypothetical protein
MTRTRIPRDRSCIRPRNRVSYQRLCAPGGFENGIPGHLHSRYPSQSQDRLPLPPVIQQASSFPTPLELLNALPMQVRVERAKHVPVASDNRCKLFAQNDLSL